MCAGGVQRHGWWCARVWLVVYTGVRYCGAPSVGPRSTPCLLLVLRAHRTVCVCLSSVRVTCWEEAQRRRGFRDAVKFIGVAERVSLRGGGREEARQPAAHTAAARQTHRHTWQQRKPQQDRHTDRHKLHQVSSGLGRK
eukprot:1231110-Rhodomonas_salina.2